MRKLLKEIAAIMRDLETLNMVKRNSIFTALKMESNKYTLTITMYAAKEIVNLSLGMFQELKESGYVMVVEQNIQDDPYCCVLCVKFYIS